MSITKLEVAAEKPDQETIAVLEDALELAKRGELFDLVLCGRVGGGRIYSNFVNVDMLNSVGMLEFLKHRIMCDRESEPAS